MVDDPQIAVLERPLQGTDDLSADILLEDDLDPVIVLATGGTIEEFDTSSTLAA